MLLTKIKFSKFYNCKQYFFKLVRILVNENILFVSIWDPTVHEHIHNQGTLFLTQD
jgi:hypothetical protein